MAVPSRRELLRWFHEIEDDQSRSQVLLNGANLIGAAVSDGLIDAGDDNTFADMLISMSGEDLIAFDAFHRGLQQFGENPSYDLQQAQDFRSTTKGRQWVAEPGQTGPSFQIENSQIGQLAGRDINNTTVLEFFTLVEREIDRSDADAEVRAEARRLIDRLKSGAAEIGTGTAGGVAAQAIARVIGLS